MYSIRFPMSVMMAMQIVLWHEASAAVQCPPGGTYYDKHVGRRSCCSEWCEVKNVQSFMDQCTSKCPNYELDKAKAQISNTTDIDTNFSLIPVAFVIAFVVVCVAAGVVVALKRGCFRQAIRHQVPLVDQSLQSNAGPRQDGILDGVELDHLLPEQRVEMEEQHLQQQQQQDEQEQEENLEGQQARQPQRRLQLLPQQIQEMEQLEEERPDGAAPPHDFRTQADAIVPNPAIPALYEARVAKHPIPVSGEESWINGYGHPL